MGLSESRTLGQYNKSRTSKIPSVQKIINNNKYCNDYMAFYTDASCTQLKEEYSSISDEELRTAMNTYGTDLTNIAIKIKTTIGLITKKNSEYTPTSHTPM
ncbi:MAG: hypothetical protein IKC70_03175 [Bacteroidaceae bacterium]|nr:hypothetical protein [Bacteroidaceae bacterium]